MTAVELAEITEKSPNRRPARRQAEPRILVVTTVAPTARGFLLPFGAHFRNMGWGMDLLSSGASSDPECVSAFGRVFDIDWARTPFDPRNAKAIAKVRAVVEEGDYQIVHVHTPVASFVTRFAIRKLRRRTLKTIYTAHGFHFHPNGSTLRNAAFLSLEKLAGRWTDFLVVMNDDDLKSSHRHRIVQPGRTRFMPGIGVDTDFYSPHSVSQAQIDVFRQQLGLRPTDFLFLMAAEFIPRKRHIDALEAFARLNHHNTHLAFAGDGPLLEEMRSKAHETKAGERIHFLGLRRDMPVLMRASQALLLPSAQEGLPRCALEALCLELPVIGSDIRGTRDLLRNGAGILFPVADVGALCQAMHRIVETPAAVVEMQQIARQEAPKYSLSQILEMHTQLYSEALCTGVS